MSINNIYAPESKYGYRININHPKIQPLYEAYKRKKRAMILSRKGLILKTSCLRGLKSGKERTKVFRKVKRLCAEIVIDKPYFRLMMNGRKNYVIDRDRSALRVGRLLSIKEIATINGISVDSVKTARKRLRKSLNLTGEDVSLLGFLSKY